MQNKVEETDVVMVEVETVSQQYFPLSTACSSIYFTLESLNQVNRGRPIDTPPESYQSGRSKNIGGDVVFRYLDVKCRSIASALYGSFLWVNEFILHGYHGYLGQLSMSILAHNVLCVERATLTHFIWDYLM